MQFVGTNTNYITEGYLQIWSLCKKYHELQLPD